MTAPTAVCRANHLIALLLSDAPILLDNGTSPERLHELARVIRDAGEAIEAANASPQQDAGVVDLYRAYGSNLRLVRDELSTAISHLRQRRERLLQERSQIQGALAWICAEKRFED